MQPYPFCHGPDRQDARPVEVLVELACLDELIVLDVLLHLLAGPHEVVVLAVHLVLSPRAGRVCGRRD